MKKALIIGGSGGIGFELAKTLSRKGINVEVTSYNGYASCKSKIKSEKLSNIHITKVDLSNSQDLKSFVEETIIKGPKIDFLIHTLTSKELATPSRDLSWERYENGINLEVKTLFEIIKALRKSKKPEDKISSVVVLTEYCIGKPPSGLSPYIVTKNALMGLVKSFVSDLSKENFRFNMVSPGMVNTPLISELPKKLIELNEEKNPLKRIGNPQDIVNTIVFLLSEESSYINGANILVNGGNVII